MSGAVALAGMSALRAGAGLVTVAVSDKCQDVVAGFDPCYMTVSLADDDAGRLSWGCHDALMELSQKATCMGLGPGLGRSADLDRLVPWLYRHVSVPMVVDADGLNALG